MQNSTLRIASSAKPTGALKSRIVRPSSPPGKPFALTFDYLRRHAMRKTGLPDEINRWRRNNFHRLVKPFALIQLAQRLGIATFYGKLHLARLRPLAPDRLLTELMAEWLWVGARLRGITFPDYCASKGFEIERFNFGLASLRVVTDTGVAFIVDSGQNLTEMENLKFHGLGTGGAAEAAANTALTTELTTQYNPDNTRATGSTTEAAANIYRTVGTNTIDVAGPVAITEHGVFSQAATGGGVLLDRSLFAANNLVNGDSLQTTYDLTLTSGG